MIVTDLKKVPRKNKYDVYVDGEKAFCLSDVGIINAGIKVGCTLSEEFFTRTLKELTFADVTESLLNILGQTALTEAVARGKLKQKGFDDEAIEYAIRKAVSYGYINDEEYAKSYISYTTSKSKLRIVSELKKKGIDKHLFSEALDEYDEESACVLAMKPGVKRVLDENEKNKLFARFYMQGFPLSTIKNAYAELIGDITGE